MRRRRRAFLRRAALLRAGLSRQVHPPDRALAADRHGGHPRARARPETRREPGAARGDRQPGGSERHHRLGGRRQVGAGRLYAARRQHHRPCHQRHAAGEDAVRQPARLRAHQPAGLGARRHCQPAVAAGEEHPRADRAREGEARAADLRLVRRRQQRASRRRAVQDHGGRRPAARSLQGRPAGDRRPARRAGVHLHPGAALGGAAGQGGPPAPAGGHERAPLLGDAGHADDRGIRAARFRSEQLVRPDGARGHAARDRGAPERGDREGAAGAGGAGTARCARLRNPVEHAAGIHRAAQGETEKWAKVIKTSGARTE